MHDITVLIPAPAKLISGILRRDDLHAYRDRLERKSTVELVFGCSKQATGFRQFLLRGLAKVRDELGLVCLGYNLRKLPRAA